MSMWRGVARVMLFAAMSLLAANAVAETAWVTDKLRLGVYEAPDTSDEPFRFLDSGDSVEILESNRFYAKVRLPDGQQGWVRVAYLVDEPPARVRIAEVEQERDRLAAAVEQSDAQAAARRERLEQREREITAAETARQEEQAELIRLREENMALETRLARFRTSVPVGWAFGMVLLALIAGAMAVSWWHDRQSRRRHGGYRIY